MKLKKKTVESPTRTMGGDGKWESVRMYVGLHNKNSRTLQCSLCRTINMSPAAETETERIKLF